MCYAEFGIGKMKEPEDFTSGFLIMSHCEEVCTATK